MIERAKQQQGVSFSDYFLQMWAEKPKDLFKTISYTAQWASHFFPEIGAIPACSTAIGALTKAIDAFALSDLASDTKNIKNTTYSYIKGEKEGSTKNLFTATADFTSSSCETIRWLATTSIYVFTKAFLRSAGLIGTGAMTLSFAIKSISAINDLDSDNLKPNDIVSSRIKAISNIALTILGASLFYGVFIGLMPQIAILGSSTISLLSNYLTYEPTIEKPVEQLQVS